MWRNDTKWKYMFMFPLKSLARKGLRNNKPVTVTYLYKTDHLHDLAQDCGNSSAEALELQQSCMKPFIWHIPHQHTRTTADLPQLQEEVIQLTHREAVPLKTKNTATYHKVSNISLSKSQNLNDSRLILQLSFPNALKLGVKSRMKM